MTKIKLNRVRLEKRKPKGHQIDMTPTWTQASSMLAMVIENGTNEGRKAAADEVQRMGRIIDDLQEQIRRLKQ